MTTGRQIERTEEEVIKQALKRVLGAHAMDLSNGSIKVGRIDRRPDGLETIWTMFDFSNGLLSGVSLSKRHTSAARGWFMRDGEKVWARIISVEGPRLVIAVDGYAASDSIPSVEWHPDEVER